MARVFLSYARDDVAAAKHLAAGIERAGHSVWWDHHIQGGSRFASEIDRELKSADAVVVLWSQTSVDSAWVQDEAAEGRDSGRLIPAVMGAVKPPLGFRQFQSIDLGKWDGDDEPAAIGDLIAAIAQVTGETQSEAATGARPDNARQRRASVCVLPFINMSGEAEQEYFSDGISEDIITDLSKVSALSIVARNTAFMFKGQSLDVKEVAQKLGVSHVLEGSVRKAGNRVRITAQLIDGGAGDHVWADRYDRELDDIFEIQDEISKAIVAALQVKLLPKEKSAIENRGTTSVDAYNLYLMARQQWISGAFGNPRRDEAIERLCREATLLDPEYAQAWALMALAQLELRFLHGHDENALPAAERALEINPDLPEAHAVKARYLEEEGRAAEAQQQIRTALKVNPDSWEVNRETARMLFRHGEIRDAIPFFEKAAALMDTDWSNPMMLITCYDAIGEKAQSRKAAQIALERVERALSQDPVNGTALAVGAYSLAMFGEEERAREWIRRALLLDPDNLNMRYNLACTIVRQLGDIDETLNTLKPFFERTNSRTFLRHMEQDPDFDPIREDPRFKNMLASAKKRLGVKEPAQA